MGRNTRGVKGIALVEGDEVVGMVVTDPEGSLLTDLRERLRQADAVRCQRRRRNGGRGGDGGDAERSRRADRATPSRPRPRRARKGPATARRCAIASSAAAARASATSAPSSRNGPVVGVLAVRDGDDIMLITTQGMVNRTHVARDPAHRPQHAGRPRHEPERRRQDRVDREGAERGSAGDDGVIRCVNSEPRP